MNFKYFLVNKLSLKVDSKIFFIDNFSCKKIMKTNTKKLFFKNKCGKTVEYKTN